MKNVMIFLLLLTVTKLFSQSNNSCHDESDTTVDLNSISKCLISTTEKQSINGDRVIAVRVSSSKKRKVSKKRYAIRRSFNASRTTPSVDVVSRRNTIVSSNLPVGTAGYSAPKPISYANSSTAIVTYRPENISVKKEKRVENILTFNQIDVIPLFEGCGNKTAEKNKACFNKKMIKHIKKYFSYPKEAEINRVQGDVWVKFVIDENGNVTNINAKGPKNTEILEQEAIRVISNLEKFTPAKKDGKNVNTSYTIPISFILD